MQRVRIEIDEPVVVHSLSLLPAKLSDGRATSDDAGGLPLPFVVREPVVLDLEATSGERLRVSGTRLQATVVAEPRFVEDLPPEMDPELSAN